MDFKGVYNQMNNYSIKSKTQGFTDRIPMNQRLKLETVRLTYNPQFGRDEYLVQFKQGFGIPNWAGESNLLERYASGDKFLTLFTSVSQGKAMKEIRKGVQFTDIADIGSIM